MARFQYQMLAFTLASLVFFSLPVHGQNVWPDREAMLNDIQFWKSVFTIYSNDQYVLHDAENLKIVYKILTFDSTVSDKNRQKQIDDVKDEIQHSLLKLANHGNKKEELSGFEQYLAAIFGDSVDIESLKKAGRQIRAQQGMRTQFREGLGRALTYLPFIQQVFRDQGLPEDLAYLPHIESSYNPLAHSYAGAAGMWQFMRSTARLYMKVNRVIDQRYDPMISTRAAARLLKWNYKETGNWGLAITAYNFGLAGIKKAARQCGSDYLKVRESFNHRRFRFASRNFYPEFLAVVDIMRDVDKYFPDVRPTTLPAFLQYELKNSVSLPRLAKRLNVDITTLRQLNPVYTSRVWRGWTNVPAGYSLLLPVDCDLAAVENYFRKTVVDIPEEKIAEAQSELKPVSPKQPLSVLLPEPDQVSPQIGGTAPISLRKPGVEADNVLRTGLSASWKNLLAPGQKTDIELSLSGLESELGKRLAVNGNTIVVFTNETMGHYAEWLNIPINQLRRLNGFRHSRTIYQGQKLQLDFSRVSGEEFVKRRLNYHLSTLKDYLNKRQIVRFIDYQVNRGESVWKIAQNHYRVPLEIIQYLNSGADINRLYPGDVVRIPVFETINSIEETL